MMSESESSAELFLLVFLSPLLPLVCSLSQSINLAHSLKNANNLCVILKKAHLMQVMRSYPSTHSLTLHLNHLDAKAVTQTKSHQFLGVEVDEFFNWNVHIGINC